MSMLTDEWRRVHGITGGLIRPGGLDLTRRALAFCSPSPAARILDVGCGAGTTVGALRREGNWNAVGVDRSAELLRLGQGPDRNSPVTQARGERLPLADASVDVVLAECLLSVLADADQGLSEFYRVLRPGGTLIVSDVYLRRTEGIPEIRRLALAGCLAGAKSQEELADRLVAHGFRTQMWLDASPTLKQMAAQLTWEGGSLAQLWGRQAGSTTCLDPAAVRRVIAAARPGYFLLAAERLACRSPFFALLGDLCLIVARAGGAC